VIHATVNRPSTVAPSKQSRWNKDHEGVFPYSLQEDRLHAGLLVSCATATDISLDKPGCFADYLVEPIHAAVAELADARDLKSLDGQPSCRFDPGQRHHIFNDLRLPFAMTRLTQFAPFARISAHGFSLHPF
jgi:hypothetical protein